MKKISVLNQRVGIDNLSDHLKKAFQDSSYEEFYSIVAYITWSGIGLIHKELECFYDKGKKVIMIVGMSENLSEYNVLRYLVERLSKAKLNVFYAPNNTYEFHPKLYFFKGKKKSLVFVGSNNLTQGGLYANSECCIKIEYDNLSEKVFDSEIIDVITTYSDPTAPFSKRNLRKVDKIIMKIYTDTEVKTSFKKKSKFRDALSEIFPEIKLENISNKFEKLAYKEKSKKQIKKEKNINLLLEIKKETGDGGTQVQIPTEAIKDYFNADIDKNNTIVLKIEKNEPRPAVICHFDNDTHRISIPEIYNKKRPLLIKFSKTGPLNNYTVKFIEDDCFEKTIILCRNRTNKNAKRWIVF